MDNILDKVIELQTEQVKNNLNPEELVAFAFQSLAQREKDILKARYGLDKVEKETLESIGHKLEITRERVRQIENSALKKARNIAGLKDKLNPLISLVVKNISEYGHIRHEDMLLNELLENSTNEAVGKNRLLFIFNNFLNDYIQPVDIIHTEKAWAVKDKDLSHFPVIVEGVKNILNQHQEPLHLKDIVERINQQTVTENIQTLITELTDLNKAINSYLEVSIHFKKNLFDKWGLSHWRLVNPKRMRDKIYLVLTKDKQPLHYKKISERINEEKFDHKNAHPATIHNELILDDRFVLIGRGTYALAEWGYKPGVIAEVIKEVLQTAGQPLTREEIVEQVLQRRLVKEGSINLTLLDTTLFNKLSDGRYALKS